MAAGSIDTKNTRRDTHLRSADFFDSGNYPDIAFTAEAIRPSGQGVAVTGALTVRGRTRLLSFDAAASVRDDGKVWLDAEVVAVDSLHRPSVLLYPSRRRDAAASMSWGCRERGSRGRTRSASPVSSRPAATSGWLSSARRNAMSVVTPSTAMPASALSSRRSTCWQSGPCAMMLGQHGIVDAAHDHALG